MEVELVMTPTTVPLLAQSSPPSPRLIEVGVMCLCVFRHEGLHQFIISLLQKGACDESYFILRGGPTSLMLASLLQGPYKR